MFHNNFFKDKVIIIFFFIFKYRRKRPKISIFLPIYNKEKYIIKCIRSIQNQTLKDLEIIAINDNSNDSTLEKLITLAKSDKRIKIVNNDKNHGLLYSRAMGILNSSGEYLMNVDPDDILNDNDSLEYLNNQTILFNADIISFDIYNKRQNKTFKCQNNDIIQKQPKLFDSLFNKNNIINDYLIWNKLIKKHVFQKAYEFFKQEIYNGKWNYYEDDIWNILVNRYAKSKLCVNRLVYIYNYNNDSLLSKRLDIIEFKNVIYRHEMYKKLFTTKNDEKYFIAEYHNLINRLSWSIKSILLINDNELNRKIKKICKLFLSNYNCSITDMNYINKILKLIN